MEQGEESYSDVSKKYAFHSCLYSFKRKNAPWYFTVWRRVAGISFYNFRFWISIPGEISKDNMVSGIPE